MNDNTLQLYWLHMFNIFNWNVVSIYEADMLASLVQESGNSYTMSQAMGLALLFRNST